MNPPHLFQIQSGGAAFPNPALAIFLLTVFTAAWAPAAVVVWEPVSTIAGASDVSTSGTLVKAFNLGGSNTTVNGITFTGDNLNGVTSGVLGTGSGSLSMQTASNVWIGNIGAVFGSANSPFASLSAPYQALLNTAMYAANGSATYTLQSLVIGQAYLVQFWINDSRGTGSEGRYNQFTAGNFSGNVDVNASNTVGGVGQFVIGTFVADATTQAINVTAGFVSPSTSSVIQLNGYQLRAIPEPSAALMVLVGMIALVWPRRSGERASELTR